MKKILIFSGLSLLVALAVRAQDKAVSYTHLTLPTIA